MPKLIFGFEFDTETKEVRKIGNMPTVTAVRILQEILIAELTDKKSMTNPYEKEIEDGAHTG